MEIILPLLQLIVSLSVLFIWTFRYHIIQKEFREFKIDPVTRNIVGTLKISISTLLIIGIWMPDLIAPSAVIMGSLMVGAQYYHKSANSSIEKRVPSLLLFFICLLITAYSIQIG